MIVTVNPNTAIDRAIFVDDFKLGRTIRAKRALWGMGGKATCCSWAMGAMGVPSLALGFVAGWTGELLEDMLQSKGVQPDFVVTDGETQIAVVVVCESSRHQSTITSEGLL